MVVPDEKLTQSLAGQSQNKTGMEHIVAKTAWFARIPVICGSCPVQSSFQLGPASESSKGTQTRTECRTWADGILCLTKWILIIDVLKDVVLIVRVSSNREGDAAQAQHVHGPRGAVAANGAFESPEDAGSLVTLCLKGKPNAPDDVVEHDGHAIG